MLASMLQRPAFLFSFAIFENNNWKTGERYFFYCCTLFGGSTKTAIPCWLCTPGILPVFLHREEYLVRPIFIVVTALSLFWGVLCGHTGRPVWPKENFSDYQYGGFCYSLCCIIIWIYPSAIALASGSIYFATTVFVYSIHFSGISMLLRRK